LPGAPRTDDVGQEESESSVIVQPPDIDDGVAAFSRELGKVRQYLLGQLGTTRTLVEGSRIIVLQLGLAQRIALQW